MSSADRQSPVHSIRIFEGMEKEWDGIGNAILVISAVCLGSIWLHRPFHLPKTGEPTGFSLLGGMMPNHDIASVVILFGFLLGGVGSLIWTLVDCFDRKSRGLWFVPMILSSLCCVPAFGQLLYMVLGRK